MTSKKLQTNITSLLLRWRLHEMDFTADIEKMYRQIRMDKEDKQYQRIVWQFHPKEQLQYYQIKIVSFGTKTAPFLAISNT